MTNKYKTVKKCTKNVYRISRYRVSDYRTSSRDTIQSQATLTEPLLFEFEGKVHNVIPNNTPEIVKELKYRVKQMGEIQIMLHRLRGWTIEFRESGKNILGTCDFDTKTIIIAETSVYILDYPTLSQILLHEIAHAVVGIKHGHDSIWEEKAMEIGCDALIELKVKKLTKVDGDKYRVRF